MEVAQTRSRREPKRPPVLRGALRIACCAILVPLVAPLAAGEPPADEGSVQALDRVQAEQERLKKMLQGMPKAYIDKVMVPGDLPAMGEGGDVAAEPEGRRSWLAETRVSAGRHEGDTQGQRHSATEVGQRVAYRRDTVNWGSFEIDADVRSATGDVALGWDGPFTHQRSARVTARSLGLPVNARTFADTAVGDVSSDVTTALGRSYRLALGTRAVRGASTRVFGEDFDLRGGFGLRGNVGGGPFAGYERAEGSMGWLGGSARLRSGAVLGLQVNRASGVSGWETMAGGGPSPHTIDSMAGTIASGGQTLADGQHRARITYLRSSVSDAPSGVPSAAQGWYAEGAVAAAGMRHEFGAYRTDRNLHFGDTLLAAGNRGVYWRVDRSRLRVGWGLGVQVEDSASDGAPGTRQVSAQGNLDWRLARSSSIGGTFMMERRRPRGDGDSSPFRIGGHSLYASGYWQTADARRGRTRVRLTIRRSQTLVSDAPPATGEELELEHDWIRGRQEVARPELLTTLGIARERSDGVAAQRPTAGLAFRLWPDPDWSVSGLLRYTARTSNLSTSRGLAGTLQTDRRLTGGWRIGAALSLNQAVVDTTALVAGVPRVTRSNDKIVSVFVRWEGSSGTTSVGVGAPTGLAGSGALEGVVYLDENRDGEQEPGELPVAGVEVLLDGRFPTTTDGAGRFQFPLVTTGHHRVTVRLESVPLPWGAAPDRAWSIEVPLRGTASVGIPLTRISP